MSKIQSNFIQKKGELGLGFNTGRAAEHVYIYIFPDERNFDSRLHL